MPPYCAKRSVATLTPDSFPRLIVREKRHDIDVRFSNSLHPITDLGGNISYPSTSCPGLNLNPQLATLANNGGFTQTMALLPGGPALDIAVAADCPATDQCGVTRPQGSGCDIGAYELIPARIPVFRGFFSPASHSPVLNTAKAGQSMPIKFSLGGD